ncbi:hypothetical protein EXIGLDRAFT_117851 [Exidia glandulosa HHB12029]|uniref:DNA binding protein Ncp1 n=1 Tax=Exidia glandulosa HHB12029 TaxID=1314781 RepID=A0A165GI05_EXIGL|nr:hypothetical protein EXIGLDRAFT_117851 [Exidia glandulosa HHB12029]
MSSSKIAMPISNVGAETSAQGAASSYATPTTEIPPAVHDSAPPSRKGSIPNTIASDTATVSLPHAVVAQLEKAEAKDAKKVSKILQKEGKTSDMELKSAIKDFDKLEKQHKTSAKNEAKAQKAATKAAEKAHKLEVAYLKAKAKFEQAQADATSKDALLVTAKQQTAATHGKLQGSTTALEQLRQQKAVDDRERSAKLEILKAQA